MLSRSGTMIAIGGMQSLDNKIHPEKNSNKDFLDNNAGLDVVARQKEKEKVQSTVKEYLIEFFLDLVDVIIKNIVVFTYVGAFVVPVRILFSVSVMLSFIGTVVRVYEIKDMQHVANRGYSKRWKKKTRIRTAPGEEDPRISRDASRRKFRHYRYRSIQAFLADLPWIICLLWRLSVEATGSSGLVVALISVCVSGFGFGVKFASFLNFMKAICLHNQKLDRSDVYEALAADIKCGVGTSTNTNTVEAIREAYATAKGQISNEPHFCIVTMTAPHAHEEGLAEFRKLAPNTVYCGGTTCQGVMTKSGSVRDDHTVVAIWALYDPEGHYQTGMVDYDEGKDVALLSLQAAQKLEHTSKEALYDKKLSGLAPSFIWATSAPGPEDRMLEGMSKFFGSVPLIGGSSADNDITGKWKQWCSQSGDAIIKVNGCSFAICHCSAIVQSQLFTGYSATGKKGKVTKVDGHRHILEVDGRTFADVYNEWTGGEYTPLLADTTEDSNILGPSSLYPLGQLCGEDEDGETFYRSMHPHLIKKDTNSVTLFSDVKLGETIVMMTGTKENIVNRIAGVASHVVRSGGFSLQELRGTLVIFCAGAMMFASDSMDQACAKLNTALGGTPFLGMHTFGEQGQFPDGTARHGNLMFSALVISSRRRTMKVLNVDTGKMVRETEPEFLEILKKGQLKA